MWNIIINLGLIVVATIYGGPLGFVFMTVLLAIFFAVVNSNR